MSAPKTIYVSESRAKISDSKDYYKETGDLEYRLEGTCEWTKYNDFNFDSDCGYDYLYDEHGVTEKLNFCPYCGDKIKVMS